MKTSLSRRRNLARDSLCRDAMKTRDGRKVPINSQLESTAHEVSLKTFVLILGGCTGFARGIFFVSLAPWRRFAKLSTDDEINGVLSSVSSGSSQSIGCSSWFPLLPVGVCSQPGSLCLNLFVAGLPLGVRLRGIMAAPCVVTIASAGSA